MPRIIPSQAEGDVAEANGELIPEDDYWDVQIESVVEKQSTSRANPGRPMYQVRLRILDEGPAKGRVITTTVCLWYEARFSLIQMNKSVGYEVTGEDESGTVGFVIGDPNEYEGLHGAVRIKHGEYDGRMTANVDRWLDQNKASGSTLSAANGGLKKSTGKVNLPRPVRTAPVLGTPPAVDAVLADADHGTALIDAAQEEAPVS